MLFNSPVVNYLFGAALHSSEQRRLPGMDRVLPQLISGPIVHQKEMMPQFMSRENARVQWPNVAVGLFIFTIGLFKKTMIADSFAL